MKEGEWGLHSPDALRRLTLPAPQPEISGFGGAIKLFCEGFRNSVGKDIMKNNERGA
jgi:hypothetical protein